MKIWEMVKAVEEGQEQKDNELGEAKATMIVNYGETGRTRKGLIVGDETLSAMIQKVFQHYEQKLSKKRREDMMWKEVDL